MIKCAALVANPRRACRSEAFEPMVQGQPLIAYMHGTICCLLHTVQYAANI